jgi:hypothetical protein
VCKFEPTIATVTNIITELSRAATAIQIADLICNAVKQNGSGKIGDGRPHVTINGQASQLTVTL